MFTQKELNLKQRRWLELLNDYDMTIPHHPCKSNVLPDPLRKLSMGSTTNIEEEKRELAYDVKKHAPLRIRHINST